MISESVGEIAPSPSLPGVDVVAERADQSQQMHHDSLGGVANDAALATKKSDESGAIRLRSTRPRSSKYKGVSWCSRDRKWLVQITVDSKIVHLGYFRDEDEAARRYNEAALPLGKSLNIFNDSSTVDPAPALRATTESLICYVGEGEHVSSSSSSTSSFPSTFTPQPVVSDLGAKRRADETSMNVITCASKEEFSGEVQTSQPSEVSSPNLFASPKSSTENQSPSLYGSGQLQSKSPSATDTTARGQNKYAVVLILNEEVERICSSQAEAASFLNVYPSQICRAIMKGLTTQGRIIRRLADWSKDQEKQQGSGIGVAGAEELDLMSFKPYHEHLPTESSGAGTQRQMDEVTKLATFEKTDFKSDEFATKVCQNSTPLDSAAAATSKLRNEIIEDNITSSSTVNKECTSPTVRKKGSSVFRGVHFDVSAQKWRARIRIGGKLLDLGLFDSELMAAHKYDLQAAIAGRPTNIPAIKDNDVQGGDLRTKKIETQKSLGRSDGKESSKETKCSSQSSQADDLQDAVVKKPRNHRRAHSGQESLSQAKGNKVAAAIDKATVSIYLFAHGDPGRDEDQTAGIGRVAKLSSDTLSSLKKLASGPPLKKTRR